MVETAMERGYEVPPAPARHPTGAGAGESLSTRTLIGLTAAVAIADFTRSWLVAGAAFVLVLTINRRLMVSVGIALVVLLAAARSTSAWHGLRPDRLGPFAGWATIIEEPRPYAGAVRLLVELDGERFETWVRGRAAQLRVAGWRAGDRAELSGERAALEPDRAARVAWQHVVGELEVDWLGDAVPGDRLAVASNRVRALVERGASTLRPDHAALARGLVIGDDRDQPPEMIERFRASGLSHLMAVSGQNVAFVVAAAGPVLRRAPPFARWLLTVLLIGWFVVITRAEPSVLRAGLMAALSATAFVLGRRNEPARMLAVAVTVLLVLDPLLAWSVGFWLSVGATGGVSVIGPWLRPRLRALGTVSTPLAITLGAQAGVAVPSILVFGRLSLVGTVANLVAVPVAGMVMLYGLPACIVAGAVPALAGPLMAPVEIGVRCIDVVATVGAAVEPPPPWSWIGWLALALAIAALVLRAGPADALPAMPAPPRSVRARPETPS
jgi:competence protein ComEC